MKERKLVVCFLQLYAKEKGHLWCQGERCTSTLSLSEADTRLLFATSRVGESKPVCGSQRETPCFLCQQLAWDTGEPGDESSSAWETSGTHLYTGEVI